MFNLNDQKDNIVFVKKANMWLYRKIFNTPNKTDIQQWFNTKEEAEKFALTQNAS